MLKEFSNHCFQKKNHGHQYNSEAVAQMCSVRKVLLKLSQKVTGKHPYLDASF